MPHRKTCKRYNNPGEAHALTFSCFRRQTFLGKGRSRNWLIDAINRAREKLAFHVWAYVIMPEHAHLLIWPTQAAYDISKILKAIKKSVANRAWLLCGTRLPIFLKTWKIVNQTAKRIIDFGSAEEVTIAIFSNPAPCFNRSNICTTIRLGVAYAKRRKIGFGPARRSRPVCVPAPCAWIGIRCQ